MPRTSAKIHRRSGTRKKSKISLDTTSGKRPRRGRPVKIQASWVRGRADNYRTILEQLWEKVAPRLLKAQTRDDVVRSFGAETIGGYAFEFISLADLILQVLKERKFPKRQRRAQVNFLADSIGAQGVVAPRSSRDICERERTRIKRIHHIIRYEYYIECSCRYKGYSLNRACPKCEAEVPLPANSPLDVSSLYHAISRGT